MLLSLEILAAVVAPERTLGLLAQVGNLAKHTGKG